MMKLPNDVSQKVSPSLSDAWLYLIRNK